MAAKLLSVLPDPVGLQTRQFVPSAISGIASRWGGVKNPPLSATCRPNCSTHHSRTAGSNSSSTSPSAMSTVAGSKP